MKLLPDKLPETYFGFPVDPAVTPEARKMAGKRGIAMVIAIMIISVMMLFTTDLIISSQVNIALASSQRDNIKAEYMAKSGMNAAELLLSADFAYDLFNVQASQGKGALTDGLGDWWGLMNGLPIGGETLDMVKSFQEGFELNAVMDSGVIDQLRLFDGSFTLDVSDESQKININDCSQGRCSEVLEMLKALFACPAEKAFLEQKKVTGAELAYRIKDWVDLKSDASEESGYNDEDEPYTKREPKLRVKNAPFDTIDELRLIEGWDEEIHAVFAPYLTIFPVQQKSSDKHLININTASRAMLQCLFPEAKGDCAEKSAVLLKKRDGDKGALGGDGKKIPDVLRDTLCYTGEGGNAGEANNRANWFSQQSSVYRIESSGIVNGSEKKVVAVVERVMPDPKKNEKASLKLLYWKML